MGFSFLIVGSRFALMAVKAVTYYLILNFTLVPNEKTQMPVQVAKSALGVVPEKGIHLELKLR